MSALSTSNAKPRLSVKIQTCAAVLAMIGAVALPQLLHIIGAASGTGTALGDTFLPMHLPIILAGFLAGPFAGAVAGFAAPLASFLVTGMPGQLMLPFMMIELCAYGLFAGLLGNVRIPAVAKVAAVQILGRAVRAAAILFAIHALGNDAVKASVIFTSITAGLPGIVIQLSLIPLIMYSVDKLRKNAKE